MPADTPSTHRPGFSGLFFDDFHHDSAWIREEGRIRLPALGSAASLRVEGQAITHCGTGFLDSSFPGLDLLMEGRLVARVNPSEDGRWHAEFALPVSKGAANRTLVLRLRGVTLANTLAWFGRVSGLGFAARYRNQNRNRQIRIQTISTGSGERVCDFAGRHAPFQRDFMRSTLHAGINVVGFITAELGVAESARCMLRAADAVSLPAVPVPLRLHCKNPSGDDSFSARLSDTNPHPVNIFHIDPPVSRDIDHHHGKGFRKDRYNIGYWAWELPDFPDAWNDAFNYYDEIWCPSDFVREAVSMKSPLPVLTMPHAITLAPPAGDGRARFGLPRDRFLFLFLYDLNSYSERKNPRAVLQAFRESGLSEQGASVVIKVHNVHGNEADFDTLRASIGDLPGSVLISETLSRPDITLLESTCDVFVSLHRSEGFGLSVAECMFLGKPVIATDWSATAEYLDDTCGCPVRCNIVPLERSHGPYGGGSRWAQPDVSHAAWWMRRLFADAALREKLGVAAHQRMVSRFSPLVIGGRYRQRLEEILLFGSGNRQSSE